MTGCKVDERSPNTKRESKLVRQCDVVSKRSNRVSFVSPTAGRWAIRDLIYSPAAEAATKLHRPVPFPEFLPQARLNDMYIRFRSFSIPTSMPKAFTTFHSPHDVI